jgi:hypothetical protein
MLNFLIPFCRLAYSPYTQRAIFFKDFRKIKFESFLGQYIIPHKIFWNSVPYECAVSGANLFLRILISLCIFREYASEITPKVFYSDWRMRQNSLSAHGDYRDFRVFYLNEIVSTYAKSILPCTDNKLKEYKHMRRKCRFQIHVSV